MIVLETDRPVTIPIARGQTWQGRDSCSGLTQLVRRWKSQAFCSCAVGLLQDDDESLVLIG